MPKVIQSQIWTSLNEDSTFYSVNCFNKFRELEFATFKRPSYHLFYILASTPDEDETPYDRRRSDNMEDQANEDGE